MANQLRIDEINPVMDKALPERRIRDLMIQLESLKQISPNQRAMEGVKALDDGSGDALLPFVLVVNNAQDKEQIVGILSLDDILKHMESATEPLDELPIFWQGQFREECLAVLDQPAEKVMSPVTHVIHQSGTLTEAVHLMNSKHLDWLPVVEGEDVVGIILKEALLSEVLAVSRL
jgi:CBS domain-containing protein